MLRLDGDSATGEDIAAAIAFAMKDEAPGCEAASARPQD